MTRPKIVSNSVVLGLALAAFTVGAEASARPQSCLVNNRTTSLVGQLHQSTFPAVAEKPLTYWLLRLRDPICVLPDPKDSAVEAENFGATNVRDIQLILNPTQYHEYRRLLGQTVCVTGKPFHSGNGLQVTDVLFDNVKVQPCGKRVPDGLN
jgi:hypothetical protein